jgi:hypothetical protein
MLIAQQRDQLDNPATSYAAALCAVATSDLTSCAGLAPTYACAGLAFTLCTISRGTGDLLVSTLRIRARD